MRPIKYKSLIQIYTKVRSESKHADFHIRLQVSSEATIMVVKSINSVRNEIDK